MIGLPFGLHSLDWNLFATISGGLLGSGFAAIGVRWLWRFFKPKALLIFERDQTKEQNDAYRETISSLKTQLSSFRDKQNDIDGQLRELRQAVTNLHGQLNTTVNKLGVSIRYIAELRLHIAQLRTRFEVAVTDMPTPKIPNELAGDLEHTDPLPPLTFK